MLIIGREVSIGKTVPKVFSTAKGSTRDRHKTHNSDQPRLVMKILFFSLKLTKHLPKEHELI